MSNSPNKSSTTCYTPSDSANESPDALARSFIREDYENDLYLFKTSFRPNKIACIGAGYVGGPTMAMIAMKCPHVTVHVVDISETRIAKWNSERLPIFEPGLDEIVRATRGKNLFFSTDVATAIRECDMIFLCVNTPTKKFGTGKGKAADLSSWELASRSIVEHADRSKIVIEKSTVPVRTAENLRRVLYFNKQSADVRFAILSNPEFLAEGSAIVDLETPDRVLIGGQDTLVGRFAINALASIYRQWVPSDRILTANIWSSELSKLVANAFLAQRVSSINAVAMLCEKTGADIREVSQVIGTDTRIGSKFLNASVGFGGSCLQKDILSLVYLCDFYGLAEAAQYWQIVKDMNDLQKGRFAQRIIHGLFNTVRNKRISIFGFSFKKNTADTRCSSAVDVCIALMTDGAILQLFDPRVEERVARQEFVDSGVLDRVTFDLKTQFLVKSTPEEAVENSHAIVVLTEWDVFSTYDYATFFDLMMKPAFIFDGRNLLDHDHLASIGFEVHGVGVPSHTPMNLIKT